MDRILPTAYLIRLLEDHSALAVSKDGPVDVQILELLDADFTSVCTVGLVVDVLSSNTELLVGELASERQVEGRRRDDDLRVGVEVGGIEVVDDGGDTVRNTVPVRSESPSAGGQNGGCYSPG